MSTSRMSTSRPVAGLAAAGVVLAGSVSVLAAPAGASTPSRAAVAGLPAYNGTGPQTDHHRYHEVPSARLVDSRLTRTPLGPGQTRTIQVGGRLGVPARGVSGVAVNVTAVAPSADTWLTAYKGGTARPNITTVNAPKRKNRANFAIVPVSTNGTITLSNAAGSTHYIVDVMGFYTADETYYRATGRLGSTMGSGNPWRWADTRTRTGGGPLAPGATRLFTGVDPAGAATARYTSMVFNVTVARPKGDGYLTVWGGGAARPRTSTVNFDAWRNTANSTIVRTARNSAGKYVVSVYNGSKVPVDVAIDWTGVNELGTKVGKRYRPTAPRRILDTRRGAPITPTTPRILAAPLDLRTPQSSVIVSTVSLIKPTVPTWLSIYPYSYTRAWASSLNADPGEIRTNGNLSYTEYNKFVIANARGSANVTYDMTGTFDHYWADEPAH